VGRGPKNTDFTGPAQALDASAPSGSELKE
jgi:hypothetical protein